MLVTGRVQVVRQGRAALIIRRQSAWARGCDTAGTSELGVLSLTLCTSANGLPAGNNRPFWTPVMASAVPKRSMHIWSFCLDEQKAAQQARRSRPRGPKPVFTNEERAYMAAHVPAEHRKK